MDKETVDFEEWFKDVQERVRGAVHVLIENDWFLIEKYQEGVSSIDAADDETNSILERWADED